jgi:large subunit ribosomal protein L29
VRLEMKTEEIRALPNEDLAGRLEELKEELFNLRFQHATGQLENYKRLGQLRRDIARVATILAERELGIEPEPGQGVTTKRGRRFGRKKAQEPERSEVESDVAATEGSLEGEVEAEPEREPRRRRKRREDG